jgi:hypothetical protein
VYPTVARLNHSCEPSCRLSYDAYGCLEVRVAPGRQVAEGEELLVSYVNTEAPREVRRRHLQERYGFLCGCEACAAEGDGEAEGSGSGGRGGRRKRR